MHERSIDIPGIHVLSSSTMALMLCSATDDLRGILLPLPTHAVRRPETRAKELDVLVTATAVSVRKKKA